MSGTILALVIILLVISTVGWFIAGTFWGGNIMWHWTFEELVERFKAAGWNEGVLDEIKPVKKGKK